MPSVCVPGANQKVLLSCVKLTPLLLPAGTVIAPLGADVGPPPKMSLFPQTAAGGVVGHGLAAREMRSVLMPTTAVRMAQISINCGFSKRFESGSVPPDFTALTGDFVFLVTGLFATVDSFY